MEPLIVASVDTRHCHVNNYAIYHYALSQFQYLNITLKLCLCIVPFCGGGDRGGGALSLISSLATPVLIQNKTAWCGYFL